MGYDQTLCQVQSFWLLRKIWRKSGKEKVDRILLRWWRNVEGWGGEKKWKIWSTFVDVVEESVGRKKESERDNQRNCSIFPQTSGTVRLSLPQRGMSILSPSYPPVLSGDPSEKISSLFTPFPSPLPPDALRLLKMDGPINPVGHEGSGGPFPPSRE